MYVCQGVKGGDLVGNVFRRSRVSMWSLGLVIFLAIPQERIQSAVILEGNGEIVKH